MGFHDADPIDWYVEMQILCDVLQGGHPNSPNHARQIPFYASNPDFIFSSNHPKPRFAQVSSNMWRDGSLTNTQRAI